MHHDINKAIIYKYLSEEDLEKGLLNALKKVLKDIPHPSGEDIFLNIDQAKNVVHLSKQTVYQLCNTRKIPHYKRNKRLYFKKSELIEWIESGEQKVQSELTAERMALLRKKIKS